MTAGQEREAKERWYFEELRAGRTTVELLKLDTKPITRVLAGLGGDAPEAVAVGVFEDVAVAFVVDG